MIHNHAIEFTDGNVRYVIRNVPIAEAQVLQANGTRMYDYSALTAMDTCPTFGTLRYGLHKTDLPLSQGGRNTALEAGSACHEYYAAVRMFTLLNPNCDLEVDAAAHRHPPYHNHGIKLFGADRWKEMMDADDGGSDLVNRACRFALVALHTSGYYDDPNDRKRTMSNLEVACMAWTDRYFQSDMPVLIRDDFIGVECPFVLEVKRIEKGNYADDTFEKHAYYCGRIDGIHLHANSSIVCENKTASRIGDAWRTSFAISAQVTGYTIAGTCMLGEEVREAIVMGMQLPPTKMLHDGIAWEHQTRNESDKLRWCEWFFEGVAKYEKHLADPTHAPRFSHSCNRYFSACQFIPYCASTREEQVQMIEDMHEDKWSPLDHIAESATEE